MKNDVTTTPPVSEMVDTASSVEKIMVINGLLNQSGASMKSIKILAIIAAVLVVQLPWIYYVPFWVFDSLKTSVASKDVVGLSEIVNQMAVSESIWAGFYGGT